MEALARSFFELAYDDPAFRIVVAMTLALVSLAGSFAVLAIVLRVGHDRAERRRVRLETTWEALLMEVMAGKLRLDELLFIVQPRDAVSFLDLLYRVGRHLHGSDLEIVRRAAAPFLSDVVTDLARHDMETRAKYIQMLGVLGFDEHYEVILEALEDVSPMVAMVAARAIMRRGRHEHAAHVLRRMARFEAWSEATLASLLAVMGPGAAPELRETLRDDEQPLWIRVTVCRALEKLNDFEVADEAAAIIERRPVPELLRACLDLLGAVGREEHIPLVRACCAHRDETVRISAIGALGRLSASNDTEALLLSISDTSPWVAMNAARSLKHLARADLLRDMAASGHERAELLEQVLLES